MSEAVDRADIQGIVASGYDHLNHARFVFLTIINARIAQDWLTTLIDRVTAAKHPGDHKAKTCLNIAFTWKGLIELTLSKELIQDFPHEFVAGMNRPEAAVILGDTGDSSSEHWLYGASQPEKTRPLHVLLLLYGESAAAVDALVTATCSPAALGGGLILAFRQDSDRKQGDFREPFGFRDGISQPPVKGLTGRSRLAEDPVETGEFVLGYENELAQLTRIPTVGAWKDLNGYLPGHRRLPTNFRAFGLNGAYLVFRRLAQDVEAFSAFVDSASGNDPHLRELIAAKLIGRWKGGAPLVLTPDAPGAQHRNDFLYMSDDPDGHRCPLGAHIRRANPRDSLLIMPPWKSLQLSRRHRIIRRGRKYCERVKGSPDENPRYTQGIYFIAINADLRRQFEFIQQTWLNSPTFNGLDKDKDPLVGDNDGTGQFTLQQNPVPRHVFGLPRFVKLEGGAYFFLPGIRSLKFLANYRP
jgi:Dyp-type peroxidase family